MCIDQEHGDRNYHDHLWQQFIRGDEDAFSQLYLYFRPRLLHYGIKLCQDTALIEDAIQDLFYHLYFLGQQQKAIANIKVYVFISLRRKVLQYLQKTKTLQPIEVPASKEDLQIVFSKEDLLVADEQHQARKMELIHLLNQLSPRQREIMYLRYYNGLDNQEIAEVLHISYQVVQNMIYKAFKRLRLTASHKKIQNFS